MATKKKTTQPADDTTTEAAEAAPAAPNLTQVSTQRFLETRLQEPPPLGEGLSREAAKAKARERASKMLGLPPLDLDDEDE